MRGCPHGRGTQTEAPTDPPRIHQGVKRDAVELVHNTGRPIAGVAWERGIYDSTLANWVRQARVNHMDPTRTCMTTSWWPWPSGSMVGALNGWWRWGDSKSTAPLTLHARSECR
jgi:transposase-like protein